ncbi:MAG TPA: type II toxin-antitoxin system RelE/ParE family toxin [Bacteroidia bacterium]|jgi:toxin ParE1/3/4|nr:type II toxin-antitoxin system RelE/ParE family toxin [Bacteroidia bacterium]
MSFKVVIEPRALRETQDTIDYYNNKLPGLGKKFERVLDEHIKIISKNPFFQIRYKDYRILPLKNFPYKIIYYLNETRKTVYIIAIFNTSQSPYKQPK